ncbi:MAG: HD domain-containing protein [Proteobacteria bacterium]|nr:HD domain-containing protein [Pseudomonadota bacterium]
MNTDTLNLLKNWFADYVSGFYKDDPEYNKPVSLKEHHTKHVCSNILMIGKELGLSPHDLIIAETIALFHDIGRFRQYEIYRTFVDSISENHAKLGLKQIGIHKVLSMFSRNDKRLISKAIAYHNTLYLPKEDEKTLFFMRLIRDADKLDIWRVFGDYYGEKWPNNTIALDLPDLPVCSKNIIDSILKQTIVNMKDLQTLNDFKLLQISWVFDINFVPSFKIIKNNNYITMIAKTLPVKKEISEVVKLACDYVDSKL